MIYSAGLLAALYVIFSILIDSPWVFRVFLMLNNRTITLDGNRDGQADYWEYWENGELVYSKWDMNFDGKEDFINKFQDNEVVTLEQDADFDGYFEYRERWSEDHYIVEVDEDGDGVFKVMEIGQNADENNSGDLVSGGQTE